MTQGYVSIDDSDMENEGKRFSVFVYGTLMRGERAHSFLSGAKFIGEYRLDDYAMYNLGWFPGIYPSSGDFVFGEVYQVDLGTLQEMDVYEGEGHLYRRTQVAVQNKAGMIDAFVYVYVREIFGDKIEGGKWNERKR